jgi:CubicO group peptidase (beta-lactamase class C family)
MYKVTRILLFLTILFSLAATVAAQEGEEIYQDPQGQFSVPVPQNWTTTEADDYVQLSGPEGNIHIYVLVAPIEESLQAAVESAWEAVGITVDREVQQSGNPPLQAGADETLLLTYAFNSTTDEQIFQAVAQRVGGSAYIILIDANVEAASRRSAQLDIIVTGLTISSLERSNLSQVEPRALDDAMITQWEAYIEELLSSNHIPGAAVAVVQDGEVVYTAGFGVREQGGSTPITPDTHMMIGSTGKSLTTTMMATMVDDGLLDWDTPVVELLPQFEVADLELSQTITMRNLVCACTGLPRRDLEIVFNASGMTAEDVVESLQTFEFFTDFGEAFQYSNQMVATSGFAAVAAEGAEYDTLLNGYSTILAERVLDPLQMDNTTISFDRVLERNEYATPHGLALGGAYQVIPVSYETILQPFAPAGAHWSTAEDMARYLVMQLQNGVGPDGNRIVNEENLLVTREPQIPVTADVSYGLGWFVGEYKELPLVEHGGNTLGFTSDFAFLPETGIGVVILTNAQGTNAVSESIRTRLFDLLFGDVNEERDAQELAYAIQGIQEVLQRPDNLEDTVDVEAVQSYIQIYTNDALGTVTVELVDDRLYLDTGEFRTELLPLVIENNDNLQPVEAYILLDPPFLGYAIRFVMGDDNTINLILGEGVTEYTFTQQE